MANYSNKKSNKKRETWFHSFITPFSPLVTKEKNFAIVKDYNLRIGHYHPKESFNSCDCAVYNPKPNTKFEAGMQVNFIGLLENILLFNKEYLL